MFQHLFFKRTFIADTGNNFFRCLTFIGLIFVVLYYFYNFLVILYFWVMTSIAANWQILMKKSTDLLRKIIWASLNLRFCAEPGQYLTCQCDGGGERSSCSCSQERHHALAKTGPRTSSCKCPGPAHAHGASDPPRRALYSCKLLGYMTPRFQFRPAFQP